MAGYVTSVMAFVCAELRAREVSSFRDFLKKLLRAISLYFTPFKLRQTFFFGVLGKEYYS